MLPDNLIKSSEERLQQQLEEFFICKWQLTRLWSHDISHHQRVWGYAKELLGLSESVIDQSFTDKLLIACYLHDLGMTVDAGEKHGIHSMKLCEEFLSENEMDSANFADLLQTIENHDKKDYNGSPSHNKLFLMLSVADDLDAFGETGIARYQEIYLARGIKPEDIGPLILENAARRFRNFETSFSQYPKLIEKYRKSYMELHDYFQSKR